MNISILKLSKGFICILFLLMLFIQYSSAQNVGIGTNNPTARLDVTKPGGDTPTVNFRGSVNTSHFNYGIEEHTYIRGGKAGSHVILNHLGSGLVGIGTATPFSPLTFNNELGPKISLFGNSTNNYGFGITNGTFQIHSFDANADFVFGYGSSSNFTERMRIKGTGQVGIGNNDPSFILDVSQRMRLRSGGNNFSSAGIYLNNYANNIAAFVGMVDDTQVGFMAQGTGTGRLTISTQTGVLRVNGTAGQAGQVITSNGINATEWKSPTKFLYDNTNMKMQNSPITISNGMGETQLPNLTHTFTITQNAKAIVNYNVVASPISCAFCGPTQTGIYITLNGTLLSVLTENLPNGLRSTMNGVVIRELSPGSYTIGLSASVNGPDVFFDYGSITGSRMVIQIIPE